MRSEDGEIGATAHLIRVEGYFHLWSEIYESDLGDAPTPSLNHVAKVWTPPG